MVAENLRRVTLLYVALVCCSVCRVHCQCESGSVACPSECTDLPECCFAMSEELDIGTEVGNVNIVTRIKQILTNGGGDITHDDDYFLVNETTGVVKMKSVVDRDGQSASTCLLIAVTINEQEEGSSVITVGVVVEDINDNSPTFDLEPPPPISRAEGTDLNLCVDSIPELEATDIDDGPNGEIAYSLAGEFADKFEITDVNCITNVVVLDREEVSDPSNTRVYPLKLILIARDGGTDSREANTTLTINITDVNDNRPMFTKASLENVTIRENTTEGVVIQDLNATDLDYDNVLMFGILTGGPFNVDPETGKVSVGSTLQPVVYNLSITVTDSELSTTSNLLVVVKDVNDPANIDLLSIRVGQEVVSSIEEETVSTDLRITYIIDDDDNDNNYLVELSGPYTENFTVTYSSTEEFTLFLITLSHPIDLEALFRDTEKTSIDLYIDVVEIALTGNITQSLHENITVAGINDNLPFLGETEFKFTEETTGIIGNLDVQDLDVGEGGEVVSSCVVSATSFPTRMDLTAQFQGQGDCNVMTLVSPVKLDRDAGIDYVVVTMNLTDSGNRSSLINVTIELMDINDNDPEFGSQRYEFMFNEEVPPPIDIGKVTANDRDNGTNAEVRYELLNHIDLFFVNATTGEVSTLAKFDREVKDSYNITIGAMDVAQMMGNMDGVSKVNVTIVILDVNDNAPVWTIRSSELQVASDSPIDHTVAERTAEDTKDLDTKISYRIDPDNLFSINEFGLIKVAADLSNELGSHFVTLTADDGLHTTDLNITIMVVEPTSATSSSLVLITSSVAGACLLCLLVVVVTVVVLWYVYRYKRLTSVRLAKRNGRFEVDGTNSPQRGILRQIPSSSSGFSGRSGSTTNGNSRGVKFETTVKKFGYDYEHAVNNSSDVFVTQSSIHLDSSGDESSPITLPRIPNASSSHHPNGKIPMGGHPPHMSNGAPRLAPIQEDFLYAPSGMRRTHPIQDEHYSDDSDGNSDDDSTLPDNASSTNAPLPSVRHLSHMAPSPHSSTPPGSHLGPHLAMAQISPSHQFNQRSPDHSMGLNPPPPHHEQLSIHSSSSESLTASPPPIHPHDTQRMSRPSGRSSYPAHMPEGYVMPPSSSSRYGTGPFMDRFMASDFGDASTYASAELDEALHFRPDQEPGIFSLTATSSYDEESQL